MDPGDPRKANNERVILHIDLDCFYCQVEHRRLDIPRDIPLAVQQWDGLIAVNYPARARGITRHMRAKEAKNTCNDLVLVHVETIGVDEFSTEDGGAVNIQTLSSDRLSKKACLERYRLANAEILDVLHAEIPTCPIEKASIDEVYIDVTTLVDKELSLKDPSIDGADYLFGWGSVLYGEHPLNPSSPCDVRLSYGAMIASRLRGAIQTRCHFTSSAGISYNKLLAKIGSAKNKPNQQTLIRPGVVESLMSELPLRKLKNFGGKLGEELESLCKLYINKSTPLVVCDIWNIPSTKLQSKFGPERAAWILDLVHGLDGDAEVVQKERTKSMLAAKSFAATSDLKIISKWFDVLASELESRMKTDLEMYNRRPRTLGVSFRSNSSSQDRTRQSPMPNMPGGQPCKHTLASAAFEIFKSRCTSEAFPCVRLGLTASDFQNCPDKKLSIARFFPATNVVHGASRKSPTETGRKQQQEQQRGNRTPQELNTQTHALVEYTERKKVITSTPSLGAHEEVGNILSEVDIEQQRILLQEASMLHRMQKRTRDTDTICDSSTCVESVRKKKESSRKKTIAQYFS